MLKIYHNPRCRKSREGLAILEASGEEFEIVKYLENSPSYLELAAILGKLNLKPIELVRKNESIWKEEFKGKELSDEEIIQAMVNNPKLIERPIVIKNNQAVLGRPPENISQLFK
ncbi:MULTISPECIES: arsenate reductase (glutaredoxin) [unclassified Leeuwenhoekiella]|uniref:arsenate reductase (glutaredoxin) n=1 Tax=unclassified Leeuwenhoekiella TaxID=2615029 RepID=UPI000C656FD3|nr:MULTISPECIES: arsenate reductase (glutaredoxin) [unclassified Leeuwenhoekiella]MAW95269.1 arsenate reductase (glutaredoxin) [Leeuwenhoekiella sp.]MBA81808.1 arsenate reductase (glutaredoxin) [Leeuwenhoekiella sp.]|tara:strand:- start:11777 stop:12121 length:345 start_codon:yes stop_codon:yes gene_type:complete